LQPLSVHDNLQMGMGTTLSTQPNPGQEAYHAA